MANSTDRYVADVRERVRKDAAREMQCGPYLPPMDWTFKTEPTAEDWEGIDVAAGYCLDRASLALAGSFVQADCLTPEPTYIDRD